MPENDEGIELLISACNHIRSISEKVLQLSPGMMALILSLEETVPGFADSYARHLDDQKSLLDMQGVAVPHDLFDRVIAKLRRTVP